MAKKKLDEALDAVVAPEEGKKAVIQMDNFAKLKMIATSLNKHYKKDIIRTGEDIPAIHLVPYNEPILDYVTDGGVAIGRFNESLGPEHSGKTRNALVAMGKFQVYCFGCYTANSLTAVWKLDKDKFPTLVSCSCKNCTDPQTKIMVVVDIEGTIDPDFMHNFDVDTNGVYYLRPDLLSTAVDVVDTFMRNPLVGLVLVDSIASQGGDKETENAIVDDKMNQNALFINKAMRKWQAALNFNSNETGRENGVTMIVINQTYTTIAHFSTEVAQGGRGLRHGKAQSNRTRIKEKVKNSKEEVVGVHVVIENLKNKTGMPYRKGEYYLNLDPTDPIGYCKTNVQLQYVELAIQFGIIVQKGGWYYFDRQGMIAKWQGKANIITDMGAGTPGGELIKEEVDKILYRKNK